MSADAATFTTAPSATLARRYASCVNLFEGATTLGEANAAASRVEALEAKGARFDGERYFRCLLEETDAGAVFSILWGCAVDGWSAYALQHLVERFDTETRNRVIDWMNSAITDWNDENTLVWNLLEA